MKKITLTNLIILYCKTSKDEHGKSIDIYFQEEGTIHFRVSQFINDVYVFPTMPNITSWEILSLAEIVTDFNKFYNLINN